MSVLPFGPLLMGDQMDAPVLGLKRLCSYKFTAAGSSSNILPVPPLTLLAFMVVITGVSAGLQPILRVGTATNAVDSGNNYWHRNMQQAPSTDLVPQNFNNTGTAATSGWTLGYGSPTLHRIIFATIMNVAGANKMASWSPALATNAVATLGTPASGWGEWFNTGAIQSLQLTTGSAATFNAQSGIVVFGKSIV